VTTEPCRWDGCCGAPLWHSPSGLLLQATFLIAVTPIMHAFWNLKEGSQEHLIDMCVARVICSPVMPVPVPRNNDTMFLNPGARRSCWAAIALPPAR